MPNSLKSLTVGVMVVAVSLPISAGRGLASSLGSSALNPAFSAKQILEAGAALGDGIYWIDPDGGAHDNSFQIYGDMTTAGGGWTLGVHSVAGGPSASNDIVSNSGTAGLGTSQTRALTQLAIDQDAQIRHVLTRSNGSVLFDGYYTGNYHGTMGSAADWTVLQGSTSALSYHFGRAWSTLDNDVDALTGGNCASFYGGHGWYYGACWSAIPTSNGDGPFISAGSERIGSYSIYFRELTTPDLVAPVPAPAALPLFAAGLGLLGAIVRRRTRAD